jgi:hypothetical protein
MTALPEGAVPRQALVPIDPISVSRKTIEVVHPVEEVVVWDVVEAMGVTMQLRVMVLMIKVPRKATLLLITATIMALKIRFIKILVTVDLHRLFNTEARRVLQTVTIRVSATLKVRLKIEIGITCRATHREAFCGPHHLESDLRHTGHTCCRRCGPRFIAAVSQNKSLVMQA